MLHVDWYRPIGDDDIAQMYYIETTLAYTKY